MLFSIMALLPYVRDTLNGDTRPQRASWLIWSVLGTIAFFSQIYEGAEESLGFAAVRVLGAVLIFVIAIWKGRGSYLGAIDFGVLAAAALGILAWSYTSNAAYALAVTIGVSLLGGLLTLTKAYHFPGSETLTTWALSLLASICALLSVGRFDPVLLAYPAYLFTLHGMFVTAILLGRRARSVNASVSGSRNWHSHRAPSPGWPETLGSPGSCSDR